MRDLSAIYDPTFFESYNAEQEADIRAAADTLVDVLHPKSALDVGCGPGMLVRRLRERDVHAWGFDGSAHALAAAAEDVKRFIWQADLCGPMMFSPHGQELVVCTEVAEHVPAEFADRLVDLLTEKAGKWVCLTAAPPGQGGHDHVNEQPMHYWIAKFMECGWDVDEVLTAAVKDGWAGLKRMWFYPANVRLFVRAK
jgi:trans-aconitate methyltransferase